MHSQERLFDSVSIVLVGKYTVLKDSYMSVVKALEHAAFRCNRKLILQVIYLPFCSRSQSITEPTQWVDSEDLEPEMQDINPGKFHDAWRHVVAAKCV
jgi:CTP synthase